MAPQFSAPIGTRDVLAPESARWSALAASFHNQFSSAGYGLVLTPIFEDLNVFLRVGEHTEIVTKEMYDFEDKGGRRIALRPENTASVVRAFVEHRPLTPWKALYLGPQFRYEKPQAGRLRQFHQVGAEVLGTMDPDADVEIISLLDGFYRSLGLRRVRLMVNTLGDAGDRPRYLEVLSAHFTANLDVLTEQSRATLARNPLRVLDSKRPQERDLIEAAPKLVDFVSDEAAAHFERVQTGLTRIGVTFELAPRLVRGLDYYTRTTFEFAADALDSAQNAVGGGGRYDGLAEEFGGPPTPSIGFAAGVERILMACDAEGVFAVPSATVDVFVVDTTGGQEALTLTHELRAAGLRVDRAFDARSMKSQMKSADRSGASIAVLIGTDELAAGNVTLRPLRGGEQITVPRTQIVPEIRKFL
ncbi:MAG: histidine--tRNA ligase [Acidimicrobiia bacterium]